MFYAWPEGYRLPPIAPPAPVMIQVASCLFFAAALFGDQLVVRILLASAYAAMAFEAVWNQISGAPRHRRDVVPMTASGRWRGGVRRSPQYFSG